jgi:hypothetical protein
MIIRHPIPGWSQIPPSELYGGVSGTWLPLPSGSLGKLDVGSAVGGPRKLGCFIDNCPGVVVARRRSGLAEDGLESSDLPSCDGIGISAELRARLELTIGLELGKGVDDRDRMDIADDLP